MFNLTSRESTIRFDRNVNTNVVEPENKIMFIKFIRETFGCGLKDAKDFCDLMLRQMNSLEPSTDAVRSQIVQMVNNINDKNDLFDILRFTRTTVDHPKMGTFDHDGNYTPRNPIIY